MSKILTRAGDVTYYRDLTEKVWLEVKTAGKALDDPARADVFTDAGEVITMVGTILKRCAEHGITPSQHDAEGMANVLSNAVESLQTLGEPVQAPIVEAKSADDLQKMN